MHPPFSRGVTQLMYVGDYVDAGPLSGTEKIAGVLGLWAALSGKGLLRVAGVAAASWVGYRALHR